VLAEIQMSDALSTFLLPTIVTGTYSFIRNNPYLLLDHTYVQTLLGIDFINIDDESYYYTTDVNECAVLRSGLYGQVDTKLLLSSCHSCSSGLYPYKLKIAYSAGLPTGTANSPDILMALTEYAKIIVNEMIGYGNESTGDIGVQEFKDQQYSEVRVKLLRTTFGNSAMAQFIDKLINKYKVRQWVRM
jgi:hypothetical protein